jgi:hypothetical protein
MLSKRPNNVNAKRLIVGSAATALLLVLPSGCATAPRFPQSLPEGNVRRLVETYPEEAEAARKAAPRFTRDALRTISELEERVMMCREEHPR